MSSFSKPTVALVYGALGCIAVGGFRKDIVVCGTLMLWYHRAAVRLHTGMPEEIHAIAIYAQQKLPAAPLSGLGVE